MNKALIFWSKGGEMMLGLKRFFRILRIKNCAVKIAQRQGKRDGDSWIYDDGKLRINSDKAMTIICYPNYLGERKLVFSHSPWWKDTVYYPGDWERHFALYYNRLRVTHVKLS